MGKNHPVTCADNNKDGKDEIYVVTEDLFSFDSVWIITFDQNAQDLVLNELIFECPDVHPIHVINFIDIYGDDRLEMVIISSNQNRIYFLEQSTDGVYHAKYFFTLDDTILGNYMTSYRFGDVDRDGYEDLVILPFDGTVRVYKSSVSDVIKEQRIGDVDFSLYNEIGAILDDAVIQDLDQDKITDLLYSSRGKGIYGVNMISIICGEKVNEFETAVTFPSNKSSETFSDLRMENIDLNRDGRDDLVILDNNAKQLHLFLNESRVSVNQWKFH
ncbi:MAG: FG-GAP repeat domain-containing protein [bacterium]